RPRPQPEAISLAGPLGGRAGGGRLLLPPAEPLIGRRGDDRNRLAEIPQLDAGGRLAEQLLAKEGVEVHAAQTALLVLDPRGAAAFVIGDHQAAVGAPLEAVDDAAEPEGADRDRGVEVEPHGGPR